MKPEPTLVSLQYIRAVCMLYIVAYWHLFNYTKAFPAYFNPVTQSIDWVVIGLWSFMTAFVISLRWEPGDKARHLYLDAFKTLYPLFVIAVLVFLLYGRVNLEKTLTSISLISMLYGPTASTLWFINMILLHILSTPLLLKTVNNKQKYLLTVLGLGIAVLAIHYSMGTADLRLLLYFPCYCLGVYCATHGIKNSAVNRVSAGVLLVVGIIMITFIESTSTTYNALKAMPMIVALSYICFALCYAYERRLKAFPIVSAISYAAIAMYLFHRPIYMTMKDLFFPESGILQIVYLTVVCVPVIITVAFFLQKIYDRTLTALHTRSGNKTT